MFESILAFQARYRPDAVAVATSSDQASFRALDASVDRFAAQLRPHVRPNPSSRLLNGAAYRAT